jgi:hypothetical protein
VECVVDDARDAQVFCHYYLTSASYSFICYLKLDTAAYVDSNSTKLESST